MRHPHKKYEGSQDFAVAKARDACVFLLSLPVLLHHVLHFGGDGLMRDVGSRRFVDKTRVDERLIALGERGEGGDQIPIIQHPVGVSRLRQSEAQSHDEVFTLIDELIGELHLKEEICRVDFVRGTRLFMLARLKKIRAVARTVERDLALLSATLRANASVHRRTETLFFSDGTDRTSHGIVSSALCHEEFATLEPRRTRSLTTEG